MADNDKTPQGPIDAELLEAEQLIWALLDDLIEEEDLKRLEAMIAEDEQIRNHYIACVQLHSDLQEALGNRADHLPTDPPSSPVLGSLGESPDTIPGDFRSNASSRDSI